jgi:hypothetical protein
MEEYGGEVVGDNCEWNDQVLAECDEIKFSAELGRLVLLNLYYRTDEDRLENYVSRFSNIFREWYSQTRVGSLCLLFVLRVRVTDQ